MKRIIRADAGDAPLIAKLADEIWRQHYIGLLSEKQLDYMLGQFQSEEKIRSQISSGEMVYYIMYEDDTPAGYCGVGAEEKAVYLSKLYVKQSFRGAGFAKTALSYIEQNFSDKEKIYLHVDVRNAGSIEAYKKMGFSVGAHISRDIGGGYVLDDYVMEKPVKRSQSDCGVLNSYEKAVKP